MISSLWSVTAAGLIGFLSKAYLDAWSRNQEKRSIAAALAGELSAYLILLDAPVSFPAFRAMLALERDARITVFSSFPSPPVNHPVFDKVVDRIGILSTEDARDVSRIYNVMTNFRLIMAGMSSAAFKGAPDALHFARVETLLTLMERELPIARALIDRLNRTANTRAWLG